jgi:DNA-binding HxlR family transcriptional regulator
VLARRGTLDVLAALEGPSLPERTLVRRVSAVGASVVVQRVRELRELGVIEVVPENDDLRLSPRGRRLQGELDRLVRWAADG